MIRYYDPVNNNLVYIDKEATPKFWDSVWSKFNLNDIERVPNSWVLEYTKKYLNPQSRILEGGCGLSHVVNHLKKNGFNVYGVDTAETTIARVNEYSPDLNVRYGDVTKLEFSDSYFDGYWSFGVIEHFYQGYDPILSEMERILKPGGYLFLTFPVMSPIRSLKSRMNIYPIFNNQTQPSDFYQFALDQTKVSENFVKHGFSLVDKKMIASFKGFKDEMGFFRPILQRVSDSKTKSARFIRYLFRNFLSEIFGHSVLLVFKKAK